MLTKIKKWLAVLAAVCLFLTITPWLLLSFIFIRPPSYVPTTNLESIELRSWPEHDSIYAKTTFPFIVELDAPPGKLLYFGCQHTADASDPQLVELERFWKEFCPTVALCEGRERMYRFASRPNEGPYSESRLVRTLAYRTGTKLYTLEPEYQDEVARLLKRHDAKDVATYFTLRAYTSEIQGYQGDKNSLASSLLQKRTDIEGLRNTFETLARFDEHWKSVFSDTLAWRDLANTESHPKLLEIGNTSRQVRGEHMIATLVELTRKGERVFAVIGASHVIRQEPSLRTLLTGNQN